MTQNIAVIAANGKSGQLRTRVQAFVESLEIKKLHKNGGAH